MIFSAISQRKASVYLIKNKKTMLQRGIEPLISSLLVMRATTVPLERLKTAL